MADEALSALSQTYQNGYSTADVMLLLDVADTTMASSGTDKGITVATWLAQYVHAGSNITITAGSTGVTIASSGSGGGAVSSVFSRTGAVVATTDDYSVAQVTGAAPLASPTFTGAVAKTPVAITATGGAATISWTAGSWFVITLVSGVNTLTLSNIPAGTARQPIVIELIQPTGLATVTWSGPTLAWGIAGVPTLATMAGHVDVITMVNVTTSEVRASANLGFAF